MISIQLKRKMSSVSGEMMLDVDFSIAPGEIVALYGASGAGKTSVLRMIAGLLRPDAGLIADGEKTWYDSGARVSLPPQQRRVGIVFQDYALFPNMTVRDNIAFAQGHRDPAEIDRMIEMMELSNLENAKPETLSGGQRQRVAVARAIIRKPSLLLLDEPFAALDTPMRMRMQDLLLRVHREMNLTTILVTHDLLEVIRMSDRVLVIEDGKIARAGKAAEVIDFAPIHALLKSIAAR